MSRYITRLLPVGALLILLTAGLWASAQRANPGQRSNVNLTGSWRDDRGRVALVRHIDSDLCWYVESRPGGQQEVFCGVIDRNTISGQWMDMPGSRQLTSGQLTLRVDSNNRMLKVRSSSRYDASTWSREDSRDLRDSRDPRFSSNNGGELSDATWELLTGSGRDVGVGDDGSVWLIGTDATGGGYSIYNRSRNQWNRVAGGAVRIDVDGTGTPWIVNSEGAIYRRDRNGQWQRLPGAASDIGAGSQGDVWIIGTNAVPGGFGIYRWNGTEWASVDGGAVRIDVDGMGNPWIVNADGSIFRRNRNQ